MLFMLCDPLCDNDSAIFQPRKIGRLKPLIVDLAVMFVGETGHKSGLKTHLFREAKYLTHVIYTDGTTASEYLLYL